MLEIFVKAQAVRMYLARQCRSQKWLADRLEITPTYMSLLLNRSRHPSARLRTVMLLKMGGTFDDWFEIRSDSIEPATDVSRGSQEAQGF